MLKKNSAIEGPPAFVHPWMLQTREELALMKDRAAVFNHQSLPLQAAILEWTPAVNQKNFHRGTASRPRTAMVP
jgi:hypothetical protein